MRLRWGRSGFRGASLSEKVASTFKVPVAGFITREIRERGSRVGFSMETFDGVKGILA